MPCPVCGGLIHPVAGKCKHCKQDLSSLRAGRPAAAAALPALQSGPTAVPQTVPAAHSSPNGQAHAGTNGHNGTNGHAAYSGGQVSAAAVAHAAEPSQPILPPRPTGRSMAAQPGPSIWRSWPTIVIIIAMLAIGTAVVLMMWPAGKDGSGKHALQPPPDPAPERMNTDPLPAAPVPPSPQGNDPWGGGPDTQVQPPTPQPIQPLDPDAVDPRGLPPSFTELAMSRMCKKLTSCPDIDQQMLSMTCSMWTAPTSGSTSCSAGRRCLAQIETLDCSKGDASPMSVLLTLTACADAITQC